MDEQQFESFLGDHGIELLAVARRYSANAADAEDAYQSALETLLTQAPTTDRAQLLRWTITVTRNAALSQLRRSNGRHEDEFDEALTSANMAEPGSQLAARETTQVLGAAIRSIRPDHARCLLLRADDMSYPEICEQTGFSYAKVNRCLSEGRKALSDRFTRIERGEDCERLSGALSMYADGVVAADRRRDVEMHLETCLRCQSLLREYRLAPSKVAAAVPIGGALGADASFIDTISMPFRRIGDAAQNAATSLYDQLVTRAATLQPLVEGATAKKVVAVAGISASLAVAGAGVKELAANEPGFVVAPGGLEQPPTSQLEPTPEVSAQKPTVTAADSEQTRKPKPASAADAAEFAERAEEQSRSSAPIEPDGESVPSSDEFSAPAGGGVEDMPGASDEFPEFAP